MPELSPEGEAIAAYDQREDGYPSKRPRGVAFHRNHDLPRQQRRQ